MSGDRLENEEVSDAQLNVFRLLRIVRNLKVKDIATALGVTTSYINSIEKNEKYPSVKLLQKYAEVLNVSVDTLLTFRPKDDKKEMFFERTLLKLLNLICPK